MNETISLTKQKLSAGGNANTVTGIAADVLNLFSTQKKYLASGAQPRAVYCTTDTSEIFLSTGTSLLPLSDIVTVKGPLPTKGIEGKLYVSVGDDSVSLSVWNGTEFVPITASGSNAATEDMVDAKIAAAVTNINNQINTAISNINVEIPKTQIDLFVTDVGETETEFELTKTPVDTVRMYVNGLRYAEPDYEYVAADNKIVWNATEDNGGFDLDDSEIILEYEYSPSASS